jgi:formate dehydrogenase gamma subunit
MSQKKSFNRFSIARRVEHWILFLSFSTLGFTGLIQKYAAVAISDWFIGALGGIQITRVIHRWAAIIFVVEAIYHFALMGYKLYVQRVAPSMAPGIKDIRDGIQAVLYNVGITKLFPKMGRYNFAEKLEYWAMIWGLALMGLTGFMLWNPIATTNLLPGQFIPAAKAAHGAEAVLAVLAILVWHVYNVHLKKMNWSMFNGKLSYHEMEEEHALELESAETTQPVVESAEVIKKRQKIYLPVSGVVSLGLVALVVWFAFFEKTALDTVPPPPTGVAIYVPQTKTPVPTATITPTPPPTATLEPTKPGETATSTSESQPALTWDSAIGVLFKDKCLMCHGTQGGLSLKTYADSMKGGNSGKIIVPGDAEGSVLVQIQKKDHPATLTSDNLQKVIDWINAGAPEK